MAPAPELASKDFLKIADKLWQDNGSRYKSSPEEYFRDINEMYADQRSFVSLHTSEVLPGYLVSARCMVQNTLAPEFFPLSCTVHKDIEATEMAGCLRDSFGEDIKNVVDHGNHCSRYCYKMVMVPGASEWWINDFNRNQTTASLRTDDDQMEGYSAPGSTKISEFIAKVFDDGTPELKANAVVDVYGYLTAPVHGEGEGDARSESSRHYNVHVLRMTEVCQTAVSSEPTLNASSPSVRSALIREIASVLGNTAAADMFLNFLVSTT
ncbi:unnamed protein product [Nippostrongylus brasiliensis]|uniref:Mini-chromosome maintenance complex-binding protein n=1 Tax=Nippostrongylus brasiliensis TaxID=27835 RepID=A0A0N4YNM8_NIPBR|nr:unnamed protein product [Nippostrongylus brasiliensis]